MNKKQLNFFKYWTVPIALPYYKGIEFAASATSSQDSDVINIQTLSHIVITKVCSEYGAVQ